MSVRSLIRSLQSLLQPRGLIMLMGTFGGLWLGFILLSATQKPSTSAGSKGRFTAFTEAILPRPIPPFGLQGDAPFDEGQLSQIEGRVALVLYDRGRCSECPGAWSDLRSAIAAQSDSGLQVAYVSLRGQSEAGPRPAGRVYEGASEFRRYVPAGTEPIIYVYDLANDTELGRISGTPDWTKPAAVAFLARL